jgi:hypothetical protein
MCIIDKTSWFVCTLSYKDNAFFEDSDYYQWLREVHGPATMEFDLFVRLSLKWRMSLKLLLTMNYVRTYILFKYIFDISSPNNDLWYRYEHCGHTNILCTYLHSGFCMEDLGFLVKKAIFTPSDISISIFFINKLPRANLTFRKYEVMPISYAFLCAPKRCACQTHLTVGFRLFIF